MAKITINSRKILDNISLIDDLMSAYGLQWSLMTKVLSGNSEVLKSILSADVCSKVHSFGDSRLSSLAMIKEILPNAKTMYIKPPAISMVDEVIRFADISLNTSFDTIEALSYEALKQEKKHQIVIMIEMGELREGVMHDNLITFYDSVFKLPNIEVIGIGTNLGCLYGIEPTYDKLIQLSLYKELIEAKFNTKINLVSGGTSITLPLIRSGKVPRAVNHFRIGEAAFLGMTPFDNSRFESLHTDAFEYHAQIVEIEEKHYIPEGNITDASIGHTVMKNYSPNKKSYRALLDFGILDVDTSELEPIDDDVDFIGTTSDLSVYDLGINENDSGETVYKVGDEIVFNPSYMGVARLMTSKFIDKEISI